MHPIIGIGLAQCQHQMQRKSKKIRNSKDFFSLNFHVTILLMQ